MYWRKQVKPLREKLTNVVCYKLLMYTFLYEALLHYELNYNKGYKLCFKAKTLGKFGKFVNDCAVHHGHLVSFQFYVQLLSPFCCVGNFDSLNIFQETIQTFEECSSSSVAIPL